MNDDAEVTLMFARGFLGFAVLMVFYGLYDDIIKIVTKIKK